MQNIRNSSIELLRLVCMISIVIHHFIISVLSPNFESRGFTFFDLILHSSVIIFVLISGFYGIKFKLSKFINIVLIVLFWSVTLTVIGMTLFGGVDLNCLINSFLPISGNNYWFITVYLELYLISPFINKLILNLSKQHLLYFIGLLTIFVVYLGLIRHDPIYATGKNLTNFILIYSIGRYLRNYDTFKPCHNYIGVATIIVLFALICLLPNTHNLYIHAVAFAYQYNSPLIILLSIFLFNIIRKHMFSSAFINKAALSALSIYLIHEHPVLREHIYVDILEQYILPYGGTCFAIVYAFFLAFCCILADQLRIILFSAVSSIKKKIFSRV